MGMANHAFASSLNQLQKSFVKLKNFKWLNFVKNFNSVLEQKVTADKIFTIKLEWINLQIETHKQTNL